MDKVFNFVKAILDKTKEKIKPIIDKIKEKITDKQIDDLANKIIENELNVRWYEICDDYGNPCTDEGSMQQIKNDVLDIMHKSPEIIKETLNADLEEIKLEDMDNLKKSSRKVLKEQEKDATRIIKQLEKLEEKLALRRSTNEEQEIEL